ncbi:MAG: PKD domain-containing protein [Candidatus Thermoplasmatota archaeon]|nr:PKD domain-containing protein [Candidatus Thermoplasmatota archaeon]
MKVKTFEPRRIAAFAVMAFLAFLIAPAQSATAAAAIHTEMQFFVTQISDAAGAGFEPHIIAGPGIDGKEWLYTDSPTGLASGSGGNLWISKDGGMTWAFVSKVPGGTNPGGSGDTYTAISSTGTIYFTDLYLATATVDTSKDGGATWIQNPIASVYVADDRQWLAMGPTVGGLPVSPAQTVYFAFNQIPLGLVMVKSYVTDDALVWIPCNNGMPITQNTGSRDYFAVDQKDGTIYCPNAADSSVYVSTDGGSSFTSYPLEGMSQNIFVSIDIDAAGNVYTAWTDQADIYVAVSTDKAKTWKTFVATDTLGTRVLPWVTAGDAGRIGLTWYETLDEGDSNSLDTSVWNLTAAICVNALSDNPAFYITTVQNEVHKGTISTGGLTGTSDRDLGDFFTCDVDKDGRLIMAYGNDWRDNGEPNSAQGSAVMFAKQMSGLSLKSTGIIPDFTFTPASPTTKDIIKFNDNSSVENGTITSWLWEFGDGKNSTEQNPAHNYTTAGTYTVKLTLTSSAGKTDFISKQIAVEKAQETPKNGFIPGFEALALVIGGCVACFTRKRSRS